MTCTLTVKYFLYGRWTVDESAQVTTTFTPNVQSVHLSQFIQIDSTQCDLVSLFILIIASFLEYTKIINCGENKIPC